MGELTILFMGWMFGIGTSLAVWNWRQIIHDIRHPQSGI